MGDIANIYLTATTTTATMTPGEAVYYGVYYAPFILYLYIFSLLILILFVLNFFVKK